MELDTNAVKSSGLKSKGELDKILGVSYPMVYKYLKGAVPRTDEQRRLIKLTNETLKSLVASGKLPFSEDKDAESRAKAIEKISAFIHAKLH